MNQYALLIFLAVVTLGLVIMGMNIFNSLVSLRHQVARMWSNIEVILKQRFDEITQLIQVVEQYAGYESDVLRHLVEARTRYGSAQDINEKIKASQDISVALKGVMAIGEGYPELKANENFKQLQTRVSALENQIADRRETYNEAATNFNTRIEQLPEIFVARLMNYQRYDLFRAAEAERQAPNLKMNLPKIGRGA